MDLIKGLRRSVATIAILSAGAIVAGPAHAVGSWQNGPSNPWDGNSQVWLLTDGSVLAMGGSSGNIHWYKLTPDSSGNYASGSWSQLASSPYGMLYGPAWVLNDGRFFISGGEYVTDSGSSGHNHSQIYNPLTNSWTVGPDGLFGDIGDTGNAMLTDGRILVSYRFGTQEQVYNPSSNSWSQVASMLTGNGDEEGYQLLADGSIFECYSNPGERYLPGSNQWINTATCPITMTTSQYGSEEGPISYLEDGRLFCVSDNGPIAIYTPPSSQTGTGSWSGAPSFPNSDNGADTPNAVEKNGKVLCVAAQYNNGGPFGNADFWEYDPSSNSFTGVANPFGTTLGSYDSSLLDLPNGQVLYANAGTGQIALYNPDAGPQGAWQATVSTTVKNSDGSYTLTGTQLTGRGYGSSYGDDYMNATDYPIVTLTDGSGHVYFCRTYNFSTRAIWTGGNSETCQFTLPGGLPQANYTLTVAVNGVKSNGFAFSTAPSGPISNGIHTLTPVCAPSERLDDNAGGTANGNPVQIWQANGLAPQQWNFASIGGNNYNLAVNEGPYCLDDMGGAQGTQVAVWSCNGNVNQRWTVNSASGGYQLVDGSGLCLDVSNGTPTNGTKVQNWPCNNSSAQTWMTDYTTPTIANGVHTLTPQCATGARLDDNAAGTTNGNLVQIWQANGSVAQQWNFANVGGTTFNLAVNLGPYCLDDMGGSQGTQVAVWSCSGNANQSWTATALQGGFMLQNNGGLCLDVSGAGSANGTKVQSWPCNYGSAQTWGVN